MMKNHQHQHNKFFNPLTLSGESSSDLSQILTMTLKSQKNHMSFWAWFFPVTHFAVIRTLLFRRRGTYPPKFQEKFYCKVFNLSKNHIFHVNPVLTYFHNHPHTILAFYKIQTILKHCQKNCWDRKPASRHKRYRPHLLYVMGENACFTSLHGSIRI